MFLFKTNWLVVLGLLDCVTKSQEAFKKHLKAFKKHLVVVVVVVEVVVVVVVAVVVVVVVLLLLLLLQAELGDQGTAQRAYKSTQEP